MTTKYVVLVKPPDDHPGAVRIMGVFHSRRTAEALEQKIRAAVDSFDGGLSMEEQLANESPGYAYVMQIERPSSRRGIRWATRGET